MRRTVVFLTSVLVGAGMAQSGGAPAGQYANATLKMDTLAQVDPPELLHKFAESDSCTVNFLAAKVEVKVHYHAKHEETVVVLRGSGVFTMGKERHEVKPGDVMHIVRGTVHSFVPSSPDVVVVSMFSPKFDGVDRIFVGGG